MDEHQLGDGPGHEEVDDPVAGVGGDEVLVLADGIDGLGTAGEAGDDLGADEGVEGGPEPPGGSQVDGRAHGGRLVKPPSSGLGQLADGDVVQQRVEHGADLGGGEGPVADPEEGEGQQRRRRDGRDPVDAVEDLEGDLPNENLLRGQFLLRAHLAE